MDVHSRSVLPCTFERNDADGNFENPLEAKNEKNYNRYMSDTLLEEFVDKKSLKAMETLLNASSDGEAAAACVQLSAVFGAGSAFAHIADRATDGEAKLISSFNNNLVLLIQKTWVEKSDEELKAQVLYQLEEFCENLSSGRYGQSYRQFFSIVDDVVYLMFGAQAKLRDFPEYALRIDPEFGIFWWYMKSLPREAQWTEMKSRLAVLLGMYFLANY